MAEQKNEGGDQDLSEVDIIILGTGLTECILSGVLSISGKKVFHIDSNAYYGGESASVNLKQLYERFRNGEEPPKELGRPFDYTVDLSPKFVMACGDLVKILVKAKVHSYLEWQKIAGSYVWQKDRLFKVPATPKEAVTSSIIKNPLEKNRLRKFLGFVDGYDINNVSTYKGFGWGPYDLTKMTGAELYKKYGLAANTQLFVGHAIALYKDEDYRAKPAYDLVMRCKNYAASVARYGSSPYLYPNYGLGGLPEGFSRRAAVHGGTFMLNISKGPFIEGINYDSDGKVTGIKLHKDVSEQYDIPTEIKCKQLVGDPSYFTGTDKIKKTGTIARCIAILDHPIEGTAGDSCQIIIPGSAVGRVNDVYLCCTSGLQKICPQGKFIACMSTIMESGTPEDNLKTAMGLLGKVVERFVWQTDFSIPLGDGSADNCFITTSVDATTHFKSVRTED